MKGNANMKINDLINKVESDEIPKNTINSKRVFDIEEGGHFKQDNRSWIKKAGGIEKANQKFHIVNFKEEQMKEAMHWLEDLFQKVNHYIKQNNNTQMI